MKTNMAKEPVFPGESYSLFQLNLQNGLGLATFNKAYNNYPNKALFPWCAMVIIQLQDQNENGHPTNSEIKLLDILEKSVEGFLNQGRTVHFIGRAIMPGERHLIFYLDNPEFEKEDTRTFFDGLNGIRPINFELHKDPKWTFVKPLIA